MIDKQIFTTLRFLGMISGGYIGTKYGTKFKLWYCHQFPILDYYHKTFITPHFKKSILTEENIYCLTGCLSGTMCGYYLWPITIPILIFKLSGDYPEQTKKIKDYFKN